MASRHDSTRTMRIDLHPVGVDDTHSSSKRESTLLSGSDVPREQAALSRKHGRSQEYSKLLQGIYDAVLVTGPDGRVIDFNSRALDFFLCSAEEMTGTRVIRLISGADATLLEAIGENLRNHKYTLIEARCRRRDRTTFPAEIAVNEIALDEKGQLCFFIRDISIRRKAQEALEEAVARLEAHDRARSRFVSNVSHELRTPLTSMIYAVANMLRGVVGPVSDRARDYLEMLEGDCKRLLATVNDILDLRKIESNSLMLNRARASFPHLVRNSAGSLVVQAEQKSVTIRFDVEKGHWFVDCDPQKMERVIINVLGNAVKFTPYGGDICVSLAEDQARPGTVVLSVVDTGEGIPADAIEKVTLRYFTVGQQPSGSGLGLAISKEIVDLHDGELTIKSPPPGAERGTAVYVSLPVVDPPLLLVVDDDVDARARVVRQAAERAYRVATAMDACEALQKAADLLPHVVLVNLNLPDTSGYDLIMRMKSDDRLARIPVIGLVSEKISEKQQEVLRSLTIPSHPRPCEAAVLFDQIAEALVSKPAPPRRPVIRGGDSPDSTQKR